CGGELVPAAFVVEEERNPRAEAARAGPVPGPAGRRGHERRGLRALSERQLMGRQNHRAEDGGEPPVEGACQARIRPATPLSHAVQAVRVAGADERTRVEREDGFCARRRNKQRQHCGEPVGSDPPRSSYYLFPGLEVEAARGLKSRAGAAHGLLDVSSHPADASRREPNLRHLRPPRLRFMDAELHTPERGHTEDALSWEGWGDGLHKLPFLLLHCLEGHKPMARRGDKKQGLLRPEGGGQCRQGAQVCEWEGFEGRTSLINAR
ncbi:hypothetical protein THAOC_26047, partial [Thalassiosira oceanica]